MKNVMAVLYDGLPHPKGKNFSMDTKMQIGHYLGNPCKVKLYRSYHATSKIARRFCDIIELVRT